MVIKGWRRNDRIIIEKASNFQSEIHSHNYPITLSYNYPNQYNMAQGKLVTITSESTETVLSSKLEQRLKLERERDGGLTFGFGISAGYSSHADSYYIDDSFRVKEFSGFRGLNLDGKLGWILNQKIIKQEL